jgi:hypothetical protein
MSFAACGGEDVSGGYSPCGVLPEPVVDVSTSQELASAVKALKRGGTIRLAAGTYEPPVQTFNDPGGTFSSQYANVFLWDTVLIGAGASETEVVLSGKGHGLTSLGKSGIRGLMVTSRGSVGITQAGEGLDLCDMTFQASADHSAYAVNVNPWEATTVELRVTESKLLGKDNLGTGVDLSPCAGGDMKNITVKIKGSEISGWAEGLEYDTNCAALTLDALCSNFKNNKKNVHDWVADKDTCAGGK